MVSAQVGHVPDELLLKIDNPVSLTQIDGRTETGNPDLDQVFSELQVTDIKQPFSRHPRYASSANILRIRLHEEMDIERSASLIRKIRNVEWVVKNNIYQSSFTPDDPQFGSQHYLTQVNAPQGWDIIDTTRYVIIGIIDSGIDYLHPDLTDRIYINPGEDKPPLGVLTDADYDGIDDDGNSYIDDLIGYDFVDSPELPYGSDYLVPDNDPMDTFGHGTAVAGIAAAQVNNGTGIAGIAGIDSIFVMPLRAGSEIGLTDLAVCQAVIYAVDMGVSILNMSFGSDVSSPLLEDILQFAAGNDVLMVAASGNNGNNVPNYPAAYDMTLSVGAVDQNDNVAQFSSYGQSLDIVAPGVDILTTGLNGSYITGDGTSNSAPMVAAAAALLKGMNPGYSAEDLKGILLTSVHEIGETGWDELSGHGRLDIERALSTPEALFAQITSPASGMGVNSDTLAIMGTAGGLYITGFKLYYGVGENPLEWNKFRDIPSKQVVNGSLGILVFDSTFTDNAYSIKLEVNDQFNHIIEDKATFEYITGPPEIENKRIATIVEGSNYASLIEFDTNQKCSSTIILSNAISSDTLIYTFYDTLHSIMIYLDDITQPGVFDCIIIAENLAGVTDTSEVFEDAVILDQQPYNYSYYYYKDNNALQHGYIYENTTDWNSNGLDEVFLKDNLDGELKYYEYQAGEFITLGQLGDYHPISCSDSDGDGLMEILCGNEESTAIYEQSALNSTELEGIYQGSGESGYEIFDLNMSDSHGEYLAREDDVFKLYQHYSNGEMNLTSSITPENYGPPSFSRSEYGDFNDDGDTDILVGDNSGHIYLLSVSAGFNLSQIFSDSLPLGYAGNYITSGDFDGDGSDEFIAGCRTEPQVYLPNQRSSYWLFYLYQYSSTDGFHRADSFYFAGVSDPGIFNAGINSADIDDDGGDEILFSLHPHLYIYDYIEGSCQPVWSYQPCASNAVIIRDFDGNSLNEIMFDNGSGFVRFEAEGDPLIPVPKGFQVIVEDENTLKLEWIAVEDSTIDNYQVFKGSSPDILQLYHNVVISNNYYYDNNVTEDSTYYYAVASNKAGEVSPYSEIKQGIPNTAPYFLDLRFDIDNPRFLRILFSEPMGLSATDPNKYLLDHEMGNPVSVVPAVNDSMMLLTFDNPLMGGINYKMYIASMYDKQNGFFNGDTIPFIMPEYFSNKPYLASGNLNEDKVNLEFSIPMNLDSLAVIDNYSITYGSGSDSIKIIQVIPDTNNTRHVSLVISPDTPVGALGQVYIVRVQNVYSTADPPVIIDSEHAAISLSKSVSSLEDVYAYPNPYKKGDLVGGEPCVIIANVTSQADVRIYNIYGELIKHIESGQTFGGVKWYLDNQKGELIANGVYIYVVEGGGDRKMGKIAVTR